MLEQGHPADFEKRLRRLMGKGAHPSALPRGKNHRSHRRDLTGKTSESARIGPLVAVPVLSGYLRHHCALEPV